MVARSPVFDKSLDPASNLAMVARLLDTLTHTSDRLSITISVPHFFSIARIVARTHVAVGHQTGWSITNSWRWACRATTSPVQPVSLFLVARREGDVLLVELAVLQLLEHQRLGVIGDALSVEADGAELFPERDRPGRLGRAAAGRRAGWRHRRGVAGDPAGLGCRSAIGNDPPLRSGRRGGAG